MNIYVEHVFQMLKTYVNIYSCKIFLTELEILDELAKWKEYIDIVQ